MIIPREEPCLIVKLYYEERDAAEHRKARIRVKRAYAVACVDELKERGYDYRIDTRRRFPSIPHDGSEQPHPQWGWEIHAHPQRPNPRSLKGETERAGKNPMWGRIALADLFALYDVLAAARLPSEDEEEAEDGDE